MHIPITDQFPTDTDYAWNQLGFAQFHVVPGRMLRVVREGRFIRPAWRFTYDSDTIPERKSIGIESDAGDRDRRNRDTRETKR
jgi:hypothetical protein